MRWKLSSYAILLGAISANGFSLLPRWGHTAVLIGNELYIYGGKSGPQGTIQTADNTNDLLILNINQGFSASNPPFSQGYEIAQGPKIAWHSANIGGPNNTQMFVFGGDSTGASTDTSSMWLYDTKAFSWSNPTSMAGEPSRRLEQKAVTRTSDGMTWIFGGVADSTAVPAPEFNDIFQLNTAGSSWATVAANDPNAPSPRYHHTATLVNGKIYVIGGYAASIGMVNMQDIYIFDTTAGTWSHQTAGGTAPSQRRDHVAVGTNDGKIIVHGGVDVGFTNFYDDVAVLDTTQNPPTWSSPTTSGTAPAGRYAHTATMVGDNMIVAFGYTSSNQGDSSIYVMNTAQMAWTDSYQPSNLQYTSTASSNAGSSGSNSGSSASNGGSSATGSPTGGSSATGSPTGSGSSSSAGSTTKPSSSSSSSSSTSSTSTPASQVSAPSSKASTGTIVGSVVGVLGLLGVGAFMLVTYQRRKNRSAQNDWHQRSHYNFDGGDPPPVTNLALSPPSRPLREMDYNETGYGQAIYSPLLAKAINNRSSKDFTPETNYALPPVIPNFSLSSPSSWDPPDLNTRRQSDGYPPIALPTRSKSPALSTVPTISPVAPSTAIMSPDTRSTSPGNERTPPRFMSPPPGVERTPSRFMSPPPNWVHRSLSIDPPTETTAMLDHADIGNSSMYEDHPKQLTDALEEVYRGVDIQRMDTIAVPQRQLYIVNPDNASN